LDNFIWGRLFEGFLHGLKWKINQLFYSLYKLSIFPGFSFFAFNHPCPKCRIANPSIGSKVITEVKDLTFFHTRLKSPVPVYGRTGLVTSILRCLICDLSRFREKGV